MGKGLKRDIWVLAGCWATVLTASTLITSASPLAAVSIGINRSVAPFTIGCFLMTGGCPAPAGMVEPWGKSVSSTSV